MTNQPSLERHCKNCGFGVDKVMTQDHFEWMIETAGARELGKGIYLCILDKQFSVGDLCNSCYMVMKMYLHSTKPEKVVTQDEIERLNHLLTSQKEDKV